MTLYSMVSHVGNSSLFTGRQEYVIWLFKFKLFNCMYVRTLMRQFGFSFLCFSHTKCKMPSFFFSWQYHSFPIGSIFINTSLAFLFYHFLSLKAKLCLPDPSLTIGFFIRQERKRNKEMVSQLKHSISHQPQVNSADFF